MAAVGYLLAAIAEPDLPVHRLVFSDWLDEQDVPDFAEWAAFIRREIGVTEQWVWLSPEDGQKMRGPAILKRLLSPLSAASVVLRGGLMEEIECSCADWMKHGSNLATWMPRRVSHFYRSSITDKSGGKSANLPISDKDGGKCRLQRLAPATGKTL
jgi:uncharacterized protein (TIGR02996 family)